MVAKKSPDLSYLNLILLEISDVDLFADDVGADVVSLQEAEAHLLQNELGLLSLLHRAESLDLKILHDIGCLVHVSFVLLDLGQNASDTSTLDFQVDLSI